jgi:hypothetical protein
MNIFSVQQLQTGFQDNFEKYLAEVPINSPFGVPVFRMKAGWKKHHETGCG